MKFLDPLDVRHVDEKTWYLVNEFRAITNAKESIYVPAGFLTDFASIPRIFWPIFPPAGRYGKSAIIHDWAYFKRLFPRKKCDDLFLEGMKDLGVSWWKRETMYWAVRAFGKWAYET